MPFSENEPQCCRQETHPRRLQETHAGEPATSENSEVDEEAAEIMMLGFCAASDFLSVAKFQNPNISARAPVPRTFRSHCARVQRIFGHLTGPHQQCCNSQPGWFRGIPSHLGVPKGYICFMHVPCMDPTPKSLHLSTFMFPPFGCLAWAL